MTGHPQLKGHLARPSGGWCWPGGALAPSQGSRPPPGHTGSRSQWSQGSLPRQCYGVPWHRLTRDTSTTFCRSKEGAGQQHRRDGGAVRPLMGRAATSGGKGAQRGPAHGGRHDVGHPATGRATLVPVGPRVGATSSDARVRPFHSGCQPCFPPGGSHRGGVTRSSPG